MSLLFNMLSRFIIAFSSKELVSFDFVPAFTIYSDFGAQENKICHCFHNGILLLKYEIILKNEIIPFTDSMDMSSE